MPRAGSWFGYIFVVHGWLEKTIFKGLVIKWCYSDDSSLFAFPSTKVTYFDRIDILLVRPFLSLLIIHSIFFIINLRCRCSPGLKRIFVFLQVLFNLSQWQIQTSYIDRPSANLLLYISQIFRKGYFTHNIQKDDETQRQ